MSLLPPALPVCRGGAKTFKKPMSLLPSVAYRSPPGAGKDRGSLLHRWLTGIPREVAKPLGYPQSAAAGKIAKAVKQPGMAKNLKSARSSHSLGMWERQGKH